ncbi:MAG: VWA domain-containing protein [Oscillatoria sp. SIO1A7]|nr:VWA domain-containing protein [Oscillatoria sp. SIO1A7]
MKTPQIELIPLRPAVSSESSTVLEVLVRIVPAEVTLDFKRPALNLGLVIDRSGSMADSRKIDYARQAASYAVQQLLATDRVSVTIFDDKIETIVPSKLAADKTNIIRKIDSVEPRNATNLHGGWAEGGKQVRKNLNPEWLNRVILLSDGLANQGQTNPDLIATDVHNLAQKGISTSTMGLGNDFNEDLMAAMANSGDGNYYYIESPQQLPDIFQTELQGLMATTGNTVSLGIEPQAGVEVKEIINKLETNNKGRFKLPNLVAGNPIEIVVRLELPPMEREIILCYFRLAWNDPKQSDRQKMRVGLQLPVATDAELAELPANSEVLQVAMQLQLANAKQKIIQYIDSGDYEAAKETLRSAKEQLVASPELELLQQELEDVEKIEASLSHGNMKFSRKMSQAQSYASSRGYTQKKRKLK